MIFKPFILLITGLTLLFSVDWNAETDPLFSVPSNFPKPNYNFEKNVLTKEGIELGRMLFYDASLSKDNTVSCGSCHQQASGFTQHGHALSHGVGGQFTKRNSMQLSNMAWSNSFGWDGGVHDLDLFAVSPITNPLEMDETLANVYDKLRKSPNYPILFEKAFGTPEINTERFLKSLSQFMLTMVSANSKYDHYIRNEGVDFTQAEIDGLEIFKQKCGSCHPAPLFTDNSFKNNGLALANNNDLGRYEITQNEKDKYKFKVPNLRNLSSTAPYMHDGRFSNLNQVLDHYSTGIENHDYLDESIKKNKNAKIELSSMEKENLLAFLNTLNDETFLKDTRFAENSITENTEKKIDFSKDVVLFNNLDKVFLKNLDKNFSKYLVIKKALTDKNSNLAAKYAEEYISLFNKIDTKNLTNNQLIFFRKLKNEIIFNTEHIIEGREELEHQLDHFYEFSKDIYLLHASFKDVKNKKYFFYCTNSNTKWISNDRMDSTKFSGNNCKKSQILEI